MVARWLAAEYRGAGQALKKFDNLSMLPLSVCDKLVCTSDEDGCDSSSESDSVSKLLFTCAPLVIRVPNPLPISKIF